MNLTKLTVKKIDQPNLKIEIYRFFDKDLDDYNDFYLLTEAEKEQYKFVTIDQDKYFEANFNAEDITLYDVDRYTYENYVKYERESVGIKYHTFLSEHLLSNEPDIRLFHDSFVTSSYYNANMPSREINIRYFLVVKKVFMQSTQPESFEEVIHTKGFTYRFDEAKHELTVYIPGTYNLTIKRAKENNRLLQYGDKYYYILPALEFKGNNIKNQIQAYCKKLGGNLMIIDTKQELAIANYLAQTFTTNNGPNAGYVYCYFRMKPFNPSQPVTINMLNYDADDEDTLNRVKLTEMPKKKASDVNFLASSDLNGNPVIGYCDPSVNLPFIIEFNSISFENQCNALLQDLYEHSSLMKFGSYSDPDGFPASDYCVLPENIKKREYQYESGYLIGVYNRHCLLCFLTNNKFTTYDHSATFTSPAGSFEPDDDCFVMVISAVDSQEIYKYDTLSFVVKLNNDQTHCGVPKEVQCALVYNVFLPNQKILKQDFTMTTREIWNNFSKGMAIKAIKSDVDVKIYRTDPRRSNDPDNFDRIDPELSSPVLRMTFAEILSQTGIDFTEGYLGYGNISQAQAFIKNIDIIAEDADIMNDIKEKAMEYIAATEVQDVTLESNEDVDADIVSETYQEELAFDSYGATRLNGKIDKSLDLYSLYGWGQMEVVNSYKNTYALSSSNYNHTGSRNPFCVHSRLIFDRMYSFCESYNAPYHSIGTMKEAAVFSNLSSTYNDKIINDWNNVYNSNKSDVDSLKVFFKDGRTYISIPNFFRKDIAKLYENFTMDNSYYTISYQKSVYNNKEIWDPIEDKTIKMDKCVKRKSEIEAVCIMTENSRNDMDGVYLLSNTTDTNPHLSLYNLKSLSEVDENHLNIDVLPIASEITNASDRIFYYNNYNKDNILIDIGDEHSFKYSQHNTDANEYDGRNTHAYITVCLLGYKEFVIPKKIKGYNMIYSCEDVRWSPYLHSYFGFSHAFPDLLNACSLGIWGVHNTIDASAFNITNRNNLTREETEEEIKCSDVLMLGIPYVFSLDMDNANGGSAVIQNIP